MLTKNNKILEELFKAFSIFWGNTGYLNYDYLLSNNSNPKSKDNAIKFQSLIKELNQLNLEDDYDEISELCDLISNYLNENLFTKVMSNYSQINSSKNFLTKSINIDNLNLIEPNRWMSFLKTKNVIDLSSYSNHLQNSIVLIFDDNTINYTDISKYADKDEVLINSNQILNLIEKGDFGFVSGDNNPQHIEIILFNFINKGRNNQRRFSTDNLTKYDDLLELYGLTNDDLIHKFLLKFIPTKMLNNLISKNSN